MPTESKQGIKELKWKSYMAQKIPVYEKAFNRYYLHETFNTLKTILLSIYQGGCPEDRSIPINLNENNQYKYNRINMKKRIRLTESDLHRIVNRSVKRILREYSDEYGIESDNEFYGTYGNPSQYIRNTEADYEGQAGRSRDLFPYKRGLASLSAQSEKPKRMMGPLDDLQLIDEPDDEAWSSEINGRPGISPKVARMEKGWDKTFNPKKADIVYYGNDEDNINRATWDNC